MKIPSRFQPSASALVIIDMQHAYFANGELARDKERLVKHARRLIDIYHAANKPVIFIRTAHTTNGATWTLSMKDDEQGYLFDGSKDVEFIAGISPSKDDITLTKLRDSAFHATILEQILSERHIETIILAGVSTQTCVGQTAADAYARNVRVILAEDAIGTHDVRYHGPTLAMLTQEYRQPRASNEAIETWMAEDA